jgi:hypothetical protein
MATMPSQNIGVETPISDPTRASWSKMVSRRTADNIPSGILTARLTSIAASASSMVAGRCCLRSTVTGCRVEIETPMSPRARFAR